MLRLLAFACARVVLLPGKAGFPPGFKDGVDQVQSKFRVHLTCFLIVWAWLLSEFLVPSMSYHSL